MVLKVLEKEQEIQDGGAEMAAIFRNRDVFPTVSVVIRSCCVRQKKQSRMYYIPSTFCRQSFRVGGSSFALSIVRNS